VRPEATGSGRIRGGVVKGFTPGACAVRKEDGRGMFWSLVLSLCLSRACPGKCSVLSKNAGAQKRETVFSYQQAASHSAGVTSTICSLLWPRIAAKNGIFEPFIYNNDHFAKTGSGQT
jgi:hypothetical protein